MGTHGENLGRDGDSKVAQAAVISVLPAMYSWHVPRAYTDTHPKLVDSNWHVRYDHGVAYRQRVVAVDWLLNP